MSKLAIVPLKSEVEQINERPERRLTLVKSTRWKEIIAVLAYIWQLLIRIGLISPEGIECVRWCSWFSSVKPMGNLVTYS